MENKKIITILLVVILITLIVLVAKIKTTTPIVSTFYNEELNNFNYIINQFNTTSQTYIKSSTTNNKHIATFNNYNQINPNKENVNKKQPSSSTSQNSVNNNKVSKPENIVEEETIKTIDIVEHQIKNGAISGIVKNTTGRAVKDLKISVDCYDKDNNKLSTEYTYLTTGLEPNETWKFQIWTRSNTVKYKNLKVTFK